MADSRARRTESVVGIRFGVGALQSVLLSLLKQKSDITYTYTTVNGVRELGGYRSNLEGGKQPRDDRYAKWRSFHCCGLSSCATCNTHHSEIVCPAPKYLRKALAKAGSVQALHEQTKFSDANAIARLSVWRNGNLEWL